MNKNRPFLLQLIIIGGFLIFLYMFFALTTSIYRDYKLEVNIQEFEDEVHGLAQLAKQKPKDVLYYQSKEYKDKYAKENLNRLNLGEKLIIIPKEDKIVKFEEIIINRFDYTDILELPNRNQWWEYFFGHTLSLKTKQSTIKITDDPPPPDLEDRINTEPPFPAEG